MHLGKDIKRQKERERGREGGGVRGEGGKRKEEEKRIEWRKEKGREIRERKKKEKFKYIQTGTRPSFKIYKTGDSSYHEKYFKMAPKTS